MNFLWKTKSKKLQKPITICVLIKLKSLFFHEENIIFGCLKLYCTPHLSCHIQIQITRMFCNSMQEIYVYVAMKCKENNSCDFSSVIAVSREIKSRAYNNVHSRMITRILCCILGMSIINMKI